MENKKIYLIFDFSTPYDFFPRYFLWFWRKSKFVLESFTLKSTITREHSKRNLTEFLWRENKEINLIFNFSTLRDFFSALVSQKLKKDERCVKKFHFKNNNKNFGEFLKRKNKKIRLIFDFLSLYNIFLCYFL